MRGALAWLHVVLGSIALLGIVAMPAKAHHGGLGIEGDIIAWSLKVDQWQQEGFANGHRIKFLAYPRNAIANRSTRLVFEVQSVATGHYVGGLTAEVIVRFPTAEEHVVCRTRNPRRDRVLRASLYVSDTR